VSRLTFIHVEDSIARYTGIWLRPLEKIMDKNGLSSFLARLGRCVGIGSVGAPKFRQETARIHKKQRAEERIRTIVAQGQPRADSGPGIG